MKTNSSFLWNRALNQMLSLATALAIVLAGAPGTAFAQAKGTSPQKVATAAGPAAAVRSAKTSTPGGGPQEGIKVHGDWTIVVRNPDGTVAERREFRNAYMGSFGALPAILGRVVSPGQWAIILADATAANTQPCATAGGINSPCFLLEGPAGGIFQGSSFPIASTTLSVGVVGALTPVPTAIPQLVLAGTFTATAAANITKATTLIVLLCPATTAGGCGFGNSVAPPFSETGTGAFVPVSVVPGRIVQVMVTFTFS